MSIDIDEHLYVSTGQCFKAFPCKAMFLDLNTSSIFALYICSPSLRSVRTIFLSTKLHD